MVLARPDERETWPYHCSLRLFTMVIRSSCSPIACWILARTSSLVTWSLYEMHSILRYHLISMARILFCSPGLAICSTLAVRDYLKENVSKLQNVLKCACIRRFFCVQILPPNLTYILLHFRMLNYRLPIQRGRIQNKPFDERICTKCNSEDIGYEFHYIFRCSFCAKSRQKFLPEFYYRNANAIKFKSLMQ